jgi:hypothetical protein
MHLRSLLLIVVTIALSGQMSNGQPYPKAPHLAPIDSAYQNGVYAFWKTLATNIHYPRVARANGVMGLSSVAFKVGCNNIPHSFLFKTKIGYGIEEEVEATIKEDATDWVDCSKRDTTVWMNFRLAFILNDLYKPIDADFKVTGNGPFPGESDEKIISDLERALKKGQDNYARLALSRLILRFPYNQEYRRQLRELNAK